MSEYPAIGDYAAIGDCRTVGLISRHGSLDWLCLPHFHSASVFAALLDCHRGGRFSIAPDETGGSRRHYLAETNVLETVFETPSGSFRLLDCMPVHDGKSDTLPDAEREVLRVIEGISGEPTVRIAYEPRPDYARTPVRIRERGSLGWACETRGMLLNLLTDVPLRSSPDSSGAEGLTTLKPGEKRYFSLTLSAEEVGVLAPLGCAADERVEYTLDWWRRWSERCRYEGPYRDAVLRSALILKLLTSAVSGSVVAAPTASLPEHLGGGRNWDYRYCWLRDASIILPTFVRLGYAEEAGAFFNWFMHATRLTAPRLQVMYDIFGHTRLKERVLGHLDGYRGSSPVRIGNDATLQLQLDVYGSVVRAATAFIEADGELDATERGLLRQFCGLVCQQWQEPDNGIWEVRNQQRHNTYSKLMCWSALDCFLRLHASGHLGGEAPDGMREQMDAIRDAIESRAFHPSRDSYVGAFDGDEVDAALLAIPQCGFAEPSAPRMIATFDRITRELGHGPLLYRYPQGYDGIEEPDGAFLLCSFWAVTYLADLGRVGEAEARFERLVGLANDVGLLSEEVEAETGELRGNFPQAFVHASLVNSAIAIERARRAAAG